MELRTLRVFVEVVRQGGFSQAAHTVFITQSAVSKAVRQLEVELGLELIDRSSQRIRLTDAGEVVFGRAQTMLAQRADLLAELEEMKGLKRGALRIGMPPIGSDILFAPLFAIYRSRYPDIEIKLVEHGSRRLEEMVQSGEVELGASLLPFAEVFDWQDVTSEPVDVLIRDDHPLADSASVSLRQLADIPFVLFDAGFALNPIILDACRSVGVEPTVTARSSQISFIVELVGAGVGIGFLPRRIAEHRIRPGVRQIPVTDTGMVWHMAWIWRRGGYLSFAAKAWLELAAEQG
ncbi:MULTISPECIES: LysR family transcriptional regulator [Alphaproteobacteria]|uniref:LysR family transcriptional regulator n=2 Tax=Alphaproteobacteria TaxID=28211 RepID=A0A512HPS5_9HYPH|nr:MULTISPECIES: LysR family transcriptional regulator [Alphaproteobacteria]GEO87456.1 LysR family transcriptional regulator [Ciceribacter naphthalenivorans]GLR23414.1 LysR family transcriptional regulator [Ciceribacter naphthalenivorans]GLT06270.1 LysR family transcriptional regulator [Sphingomonas psychrolutea]